MDQATRTLDERLAVHGVPDPDGLLHDTARAMLAVAYGVTGYDVAFAPAGGEVAVRVQHTEFGLEVDVVATASTAASASDVGHDRLLE